MNAYTLVVTSCDRMDLLRQTLESFINCADQQPRETIIIEDGPTPKPEWLRDGKFRDLGKLTWLNNEVRMGQVYSIDRAYAEVKTEYIFHCEEDWCFCEQGFLSKSFAILEKYPSVLQVSLRGDTGWHTLVSDERFPFKIAEPNWRGGWGGLSWNPGLRRLSDYKRIDSFGRQIGYINQPGCGLELTLSKLFLKMGYVIADLAFPYVTHLGNGRSRAIENFEYKPPRLLIAIPACHRLDYGKWESEQSPLFNQAKAYNGAAYGTDIHISGENPRIQAVRETWVKDVSHHANVDYKFFYGQGATRQPLADEVFLPCPDDYEHLPHKTIAIVRYAREHNYDFLFKADDDTFIYVDRLVSELMQNRFDYAGYTHNNVCTGGPGYFLSKRAMAVVQDTPDHWAEDCWVSKCMGNANINPMMLPNHRPGFSAHYFFTDGFKPEKLTKDIVTAHAVQPDIMRQWYAHITQGVSA